MQYKIKLHILRYYNIRSKLFAYDVFYSWRKHPTSICHLVPETNGAPLQPQDACRIIVMVSIKAESVNKIQPPKKTTCAWDFTLIFISCKMHRSYFLCWRILWIILSSKSWRCCWMLFLVTFFTARHAFPAFYLAEESVSGVRKQLHSVTVYV